MARGLDVAEAASRLRRGEVVAFPTETVYGLGADALDARAVAKIFAIKARPSDHPLIVHVESVAHLDRFAVAVPDAARRLAARFWPGPLTMILRKAAHVPGAVTGGQDTVGLRVPSHPVAQALLREFNRGASEAGGIAAPSANRFGHVSPTTAQHVRDEFGADFPVVDGGECEVGLESTIVDLSRGAAVLLRPGGIERGELEAALGTALRDRDEAAPRASGTLAAHYAPGTALVLVGRERLAATVAESKDAAVLAFGPRPADIPAVLWIEASPRPRRYGHDLYANLRALDASGARRIVVEEPPATAPWEAVNDRLRRAAAGAGAVDDEP